MRSWSHVSLPMAALFLLQLFQETDQLPVEISTFARALDPTHVKANYSRCVGEWKYYPDTNSCYKLILDKTNHAIQEEICNAIGGRLAVINSDKKLTFFTNSFHLGVGEHAFIGARVTVNGIKWADGTFYSRSYAGRTMRIRDFSRLREGCLYITGERWWVLTVCENSVMAACEITDVDKCIENNGDCDHMCQSIMGNKACLCRPHYYLKNQTSCEENPCQYSNGGCSQFCENPRRGESFCSCKRGYNARPNGQCQLEKFKSMESLNLTRMLLVALIVLTVIITSCRYCPQCLNAKRHKKTTPVSSESSAVQESDEDSSFSDESRTSTFMIKRSTVGPTENTVKVEEKQPDKKMSADSSWSDSSDSSSSSSSDRSRRSTRKSNNIWSYTMRGFRQE